MSTLPLYFDDFITNIKLSQEKKKKLQTAHTTLKKLLNEDKNLSDIIIGIFLQGSYKRGSMIKSLPPSKPDVDVIVVTNLDKEEYSPKKALGCFIPFLEKHYQDQYRMQGRSIGVELSDVQMDIVPTSAPSEAKKQFLLENQNIIFGLESFDDYSNWNNSERKAFDHAMEAYATLSNDPAWKNEPLLIPDTEANCWDRTHPLEQIRWTTEKNKACNGYYLNVVKAIKWWWKHTDNNKKHPKSYPLEHFIGDCCPNSISSIAEGVVLTLDKIAQDYPEKPKLSDRGVPEHDVFKRLSEQDYKEFYDHVCKAASMAKEAYEEKNADKSAIMWRQLLGQEFPLPPDTKLDGKHTPLFTQRTEPSTDIPTGRFA